MFIAGDFPLRFSVLGYGSPPVSEHFRSMFKTNFSYWQCCLLATKGKESPTEIHVYACTFFSFMWVTKSNYKTKGEKTKPNTTSL